MSKWVEIRDEVTKALRFEKVTEEMKDGLSRWLLKELLPAVRDGADRFTEQTRAQAKDEKGWAKVRDLVVLPIIIEFGLWAIEKALTISVEKVK